MAKFGTDNLDTPVQHNVNSRVLEQASDTAEKLTALECKFLDIVEFNYTTENDVIIETYTEEAQDIFNIYYDDQVDELYSFLNGVQKIIE